MRAHVSIYSCRFILGDSPHRLLCVAACICLCSRIVSSAGDLFVFALLLAINAYSVCVCVCFRSFHGSAVSGLCTHKGKQSVFVVVLH